MKHVSTLALLSVLAASATAQTTYDVPGDFATIKDAVAATVNGDTVLVAPGTYFERNINLGGKRIRLASTGGRGVTTIDAGYLDRVFVLTSGEGQDTVIEGFRIQRGRPVYNGGAGESGGGFYIANSSPTIRDCVIRDCQSGFGASGSSAGYSGSGGGDGGGAYVSNGSPRFERCKFVDNWTGNGGNGATGRHGSDGGLFDPPDNGGSGGYGGSGGRGAGVSITNGSPVFVSCYFNGNQTGSGGTGGRGGSGGDGSAGQNGANGGRGGNGGHAGEGGAVYVYSGAPLLVNCTLLSNQLGVRGTYGSGGSGGSKGVGLFLNDGSSGSSGSYGSNAIWGGIRGNGVTEVRNSIVWNNESQEITGSGVIYSTVQGGHAGIGNLSSDPLLAGEHLQAGSPCIDAGDDSLLPAGSNWDLEGNVRNSDHPMVASALPGSTVDMGCDEFAESFVLPHGCGPGQTLFHLSGTPVPGDTLTFLVLDDESRLGARAALLVGTAPAPGPCGVPTRGGDLYVDLTQPFQLVLGGSPGIEELDLVLPNDASIVGADLYVQGASIAPRRQTPGASTSNAPLTWSLLEALHLVVGP